MLQVLLVSIHCDHEDVKGARTKRFSFILVFLISAVVACTREETGRDRTLPYLAYLEQSPLSNWNSK